MAGRSFTNVIRLRRGSPRKASHFVHHVADGLDDVDVALLVPAPNVIRLPNPASREHVRDRFAVILHIKPVANVLTVAVNGKRFTVARVQNHQRYQFLRKLKPSVVIRAVCGQNRQPVRVMVGPHKMVGSRLRRGIWAIGRIRRALGKSRIAGPQRAIYFISGNVQKSEVRSLLIARLPPIGSHFFQKREGPIHICADEIFRPANRAIDVALGCKVHDRPRLSTFQQSAHQAAVCNVAVHKLISPLIGSRWLPGCADSPRR
jgi:hypothetical protein